MLEQLSAATVSQPPLTLVTLAMQTASQECCWLQGSRMGRHGGESFPLFELIQLCSRPCGLHVCGCVLTPLPLARPSCGRGVSGSLSAAISARSAWKTRTVVSRFRVLRLAAVSSMPDNALPSSGELFALSPYDITGQSVEPVLDSSRYFVLRVESEGPSGESRKAYIGMGVSRLLGDCVRRVEDRGWAGWVPLNSLRLSGALGNARSAESKA